MKGDTGSTGPIGMIGPKGDIGNTGSMGMKGDMGNTGPKGETGIQGTSNLMFLFTTSESVSNNDFIGLGSSSSNSLRNTIVSPIRCNISSIAFSIRELKNATPYTATVYVNGIMSNLSIVINDGSIKYNNINIHTVLQIQPLDLLSIQVSFANGALNNGVCISLIASAN